MKFVVGFFQDNPEGLTDIQDVAEVTGLSISEIESCMNVVTINDCYYG